MEFKTICQCNVHHIFIWSFPSVSFNKFFQHQYISMLIKIQVLLMLTKNNFLKSFWHNSSTHSLLLSLVIYKFEIPQMPQEEVVVSRFISLWLWIGKTLTCLAFLKVNITFNQGNEKKQPYLCSAIQILNFFICFNRNEQAFSVSGISLTTFHCALTANLSRVK